MKATTWLCPALTLLCAINLVFTAERGCYDGYPCESWDPQLSQGDSIFKRNKPSLSIVNPLDVLRQRLLLEIARRQMKENSRQVERNRVILKNVGKREATKYSFPLAARLYDLRELQQQQQQQIHQQQEPIELLEPNEYELLPTTLIFDYLQQQQRRPWLPYDSNALPFVNNYINEDIVEAARSSAPNALQSVADIVEENTEPDLIVFNGMVGNANKHSLQHIKPTNNEHSSANKPNEQHEATTFQKSLINNHQLYRNKNDLNLNLNDENPVSLKSSANDYRHEQRNDNNDGDYQLQHYLYHLHKNQNHLTRK